MAAAGSSPASATALLTEARTAHSALRAADDAQEVSRLSTLPSTVQDYLAKKGELYLATKMINAAGHELHAGDLSSAARYNLAILHRHAGKRSAADAPSTLAAPVAPGTPTPAAPRTGFALTAPLIGTAVLAVVALLGFIVR
jgi:hypothetical protein